MSADAGVVAGGAPHGPPDEELARKVRLLRTMLRTMVVLAAIGATTSLLEPGNPLWVTSVFYGVAFAALYGLHRAIARGAVVAGVWGLGLVLWVLVAFVTVFFGGLQGQNAALFGVCAMLIGSVAGGRAAVLVALASTVWCAGIVGLELAHALPTPPGPAYSPINAWGALAVTMVLIAVIMRDSLESMRANHERAIAAAAERDEALQRSIHGQKMELVGNLASAVAHDFNNLLTVIGGAAAVLREQLASGAPENLALVTEIDEAASRAGLLTRQLLTFGRATASAVEVIDLAPQVQQFAQLLPRLVGPRITLEIDVAPRAHVEASPVAIEQILLNLVVNARDAMPEGGRLGLRVATEGAHVLIAVTDTGHGMDPAVQAKIFTPFFTTKPAGTGLGLATVHDQVTRLRGTITVDSERGRGTRITIRLPRAEAPTAASAPPAPPTAEAAPAERRAVEVMLVDDDPPVRRAVARLLTRAGFAVIEAGDGVEALAQLPAHPDVRCVITDIVMPKLDGRALAAQLAERAPALPVIMISGNEATDEVAAPNRLQLTKPVPPDVLVAAIRRFTA